MNIRSAQESQRENPCAFETDSERRRRLMADEISQLQEALHKQSRQGPSMSQEQWGPTFQAWPAGRPVDGSGGMRELSHGFCGGPGVCPHDRAKLHGLPALQPDRPHPLSSSFHGTGVTGMMGDASHLSAGFSVGGQATAQEDGSLKSVPITLPKLVEPTSKDAALAAGDWIAQLRPHIADVCAGAGQWWDQVISIVSSKYQDWLVAGPLERIHIQPPDAQTVSQGQFRLEQRVTNLLLSALPESIKSELVSNRQLHVSGILFTVYKRYQPGGIAERSQTLLALTNTQAAASASEAAQSLRMWRRQHNRALELGLQLPDPLILVKALDGITQTLLSRKSQATFRVNAFRTQHQVDVRPTSATLGHLYDVLLSEADQMLYGQPPEADMLESRDSAGSVKATQASPTPNNKPTSSRLCEFWGTDSGCRLASACKFVHDWTGVSEVSPRCWHCSSNQHSRADCPYRTAGLTKPGGSPVPISPEKDPSGSTKPTPTAANANSESTEGQPGGKKGHGRKQQAEAKQKPQPKLLPAKSQASSQDAGEKAGSGDSASTGQVKSLSAESSKTGQVPSQGPDASQASQMMSEVTSLLKSLRVESNNVKAIRLCGVTTGKYKTALLDGVATHVLRQARDDDEWNLSQEVQVCLASGSTCLRQDPWTGSLLTREERQTILPMISLTRLGYSVDWTGDQCTIKAPDKSKLPVALDQGCPTVDVATGRHLLAMVERQNAHDMKLRVLAMALKQHPIKRTAKCFWCV